MRDLLQSANITNQLEPINTRRLHYTSPLNFFGTTGQVLRVEISDYLFCLHDSIRDVRLGVQHSRRSPITFAFTLIDRWEKKTTRDRVFT